LFFYLDILKQP